MWADGDPANWADESCDRNGNYLVRKKIILKVPF